jgi:AcrR family transcriptional regulator
MPKKIVFTRDEIIRQSFELLKERGIEEITARNIAKRMNCSPAPIYNCFTSMDELKEVILTKAKNSFMEYVKKPYTDRTFLNVGMGIVLFAQHERKLFDSIFLRKEEYIDLINEFNSMIFEEFDKNESTKQLSEEKRRWLLHKCWIYSHGLATLVCTNYMPDVTEEYLKENLTEIGELFLKEAIATNK